MSSGLLVRPGVRFIGVRGGTTTATTTVASSTSALTSTTSTVAPLSLWVIFVEILGDSSGGCRVVGEDEAASGQVDAGGACFTMGVVETTRAFFASLVEVPNL